MNGTPLFLPTWSLSLSCLTGVFRAPPSQMTSGHKLDVNLTVLRNFGGSWWESAFSNLSESFLVSRILLVCLVWHV